MTLLDFFKHRAWQAARSSNSAERLAGAILAIFFFLAGCSAQLSPSYDQTVFNDLNALNVQTETLFAALTHDGPVGGFASRQKTYDELIGGFSAAKLTTEARFIPPGGLRLAASPALQALCGSDPAECVNPTPHHLAKIITLLTAMRDVHEKGRLVGELVVGIDGAGGFKNQYEIEMSRILVFEAALQR